jgi:hypothetical protein
MLNAITIRFFLLVYLSVQLPVDMRMIVIAARIAPLHPLGSLHKSIGKYISISIRYLLFFPHRLLLLLFPCVR